MYATNRDVRAEHRMNLPHRRVSKRHSLDQNILTAIGLDKLRPQVAAIAEYSLIHWGSASHVVIEPGARFALLGIAFLPTTARPAFPWPPMIAVSIAVDYAFACPLVH